MKAYRTTKEFARAMCRENGRARPKETYYIVEDWQHAVRTERKAPNSYHGLKQVMFFADGRHVTRRFGLWVEHADETDTTWLMQRQLRDARWNLYEEFNRKVIEEATRLMEKDGCFAALAARGDLLDQAVA